MIRTTEDGKNLQNFLIACEMLPASIFMLWAFPYTDYKTSGELLCSMRLSAANNWHKKHWKADLLHSHCELLHPVTLVMFSLHLADSKKLQRLVIHLTTW